MLSALAADNKPIEFQLNNRGILGNPRGTMIIDMDLNAHPEIETTQGWRPASTARILAHEIGHVAYGIGDTGVGRMVNVIANENPVATELGEPARIRYSGR
jgi:hypothetical protein